MQAAWQAFGSEFLEANKEDEYYSQFRSPQLSEPDVPLKQVTYGQADLERAQAARPATKGPPPAWSMQAQAARQARSAGGETYRDRARQGETFLSRMANPWQQMGKNVATQARGTAAAYKPPEGTSTAGKIARGATAAATLGLVGSQQSTEGSPFGVAGSALGGTAKALGKNIGTAVAAPFRAIGDIGTRQRIRGYDAETGERTAITPGSRSSVGAELSRIGTAVNPFDAQSTLARKTEREREAAARPPTPGPPAADVHQATADRIRAARARRSQPEAPKERKPSLASRLIPASRPGHGGTANESLDRGRIETEGLLTEEQRQRFIKLALIKS